MHSRCAGFPFFFLLCTTLGWFGGVAGGHQPFESTTEARLQDGKLQVRVVMAAEMASALAGEIGPVEEVAALSRGYFEHYRPRLEERATALLAVSAGGTPLELERTALQMNGEGEIEFSLRYPAPTRWPLRLRSAFLGLLPQGYSNLLQVLDDQDRMIARSLQLGGREAAEFVLQKPGRQESPGAVASAPAATVSATAAPDAAAERHLKPEFGVSFGAGAAILALLALIFAWIKRRGAEKTIVAALFVLAILTGLGMAQRQMERLGRGVIAVRSSSTQVYVGWRLLGNDPEGVAFNLYRAANSGTAVKVNSAPLTNTTDYLDTPGGLTTTAYTYSVRPVLNNVEVPDVWAHPSSTGFTLPVNATVRQYFSAPIQATPDGALRVGFCWVGDLDGDGEYDFVIARHNQNVAESREFLEGYKRDGTFLWRLDMGPNSTNHYHIEPGASTIGNGHGDNVTVYDLDGDGKAEVIVRTAGGVIFGNGAVVVEADNRKQFISIVNGETGAERARSPVPNPYLSDGPLNGHMGIFYPDGQRPSVILAAKNRRDDSGFQGLATTWDFRNGVLSQRWSYNSDTLGEHAPEAHQIRLGDPDNDGKDEFLDIGYGIDDNGLQLFNIPEIVHGDRFHMADIDPDRPGLETYLIQQDNGSGLATAMIDSGTGVFLKKWYSAGIVDVGRGLAADIDPAHKGYEMFSTQAGVFNSKGVQIHDDGPFPPEGVWWDGNLSREFLATVGSSAESPAIARFDPNNPGAQSRILSFYSQSHDGAPGGNYWAYGGRAPFWGDILGDWREEVVVVANDHSELRIYTTKLTAANRLYTLMHNPQYRIQATTKGYVQGSNVDYYLGDGMTPTPPPPMMDAQLVWRGGPGATTWDAGLTASWKNGAANSTFANGNTVRFDIGGNNTTTVTLNGALQPGTVAVWSPKSYTLDGSAGSLSGAMKLVKAGTGTLTISGQHNFSGATTVWDGALHVNGTFEQSSVTVWGGTFGGALAAGARGGRLGGSGTFNRPVTVRYRGAITPGAGMGSAGTLNFGAGLAAEDGALLALDLSNDPTGQTVPSDRIAVTGNLALSGKVAVVIKALNGQLAAGTYTLLTYSGTLTGSVSNLAVTVPVGTPYTIAAGNGAITLSIPVTRAPAAVVWRGSGAAWDLAASQNWLRSGTPDVFVGGDTVTFDATGAAASTATLNTALPVAGLTVNAANNYTFNGAGSLSGSGGLTKSGAGTLTVNTTNDFTGATVVSGGVLAVSNLANAGSPSSIGAASAIASNLVLNGGTLRLTGAQTNTNRGVTLGTSGGTFDIPSGGSSIQVSGGVTGGGSLTKTGSGTLLLAATNSYTGGTFINGGTVYLAGSNANENALGSGPVTLNGGTLTMADVQANNQADWNLIVPAGATGRFNADGRCSLLGSLNGGGDLTLYLGFIRTDLRGNWSNFSGRINVVSDGDGGAFRITNTAGYGNAALNLGDQVAVYYNSTMGSNLTVDLGELSGVATSSLGGGPTGGRTLTWRIGGRNSSSTFAGAIGDGGSTTALTKVGTGTLTLSGTNNYSGATNVQAGVLLVNGSLSGSAVAVQSGATLGGSGAISGNVTIQSGGRLAFVAGEGTITGLNITGNLALNGTITVSPAPGSEGFAQGSYTIATYTGALSGAYNLIWSPAPGSTQVATFDTSTPGVIRLNVTRNASVLTWTSAVNGTWDTATSNWALNGLSEVFVPPDSALFDDTATTTTVSLAGPLSPGGVAFANEAKNYALGATGGGLAGNAGIVKNGAARATLYSANSHTGPTTINAGILALGNDGSTTAGQYQQGGATGAGAATTSLGSGAITINPAGQIRLGGRGGGTVYTFISGQPVTFAGGTLVSYDGQQKLTGGVTVEAAGAMWITTWNTKNLWLNSALNGSGPVTIDDQMGTGSDTGRAVVRIDSANNSYAGTITISGPSTGRNGGRLQIENNTALLNATIINNNTAAPALLFTTTAPQLGALGGVGAVTIPGTSLTVGGYGASTTFSGTLSGTGSLIKAGAGVFTLAGTQNFSGATNVTAGTLRLTGTVSGPASFTIASGAALELSAASLSVAGPITNQGTVRLLGAASISCSGTFTNQGVLDLINGPQTLPANFVNQGTVVDSSSVRVSQISRVAGAVELSTRSFVGHQYQLQRRALLTAADWQNVGSPKAGTGGVLTFTDSEPAGSAGFYRIQITP